MASRSAFIAAAFAAAIGPGLFVGTDVAAQDARNRSAGQASGVLVEGAVVDHETGTPVPGAAVSLGAGAPGITGRGTRVTNDEGRFSFQDVPAGDYRVSVTAPGYQDMNDTLQVPAGDIDLLLPLSVDPIRLEPILVTAKRMPGLTRGYERRRIGGGSGFLVTREDIEERRPRFLSEVLHSVPGGMVVPTPPHGYTLLLRGQCRPGIWMDGVRLAGATSVDQLFTPQNVEAVEVYQGFELPVEFGVNPCGGILVWTRRGPSSLAGPDPTTAGIFGKLLKAAVIVLLVVGLTR